jgi:hypothetical protein
LGFFPSNSSFFSEEDFLPVNTILESIANSESLVALDEQSHPACQKPPLQVTRDPFLAFLELLLSDLDSSHLNRLVWALQNITPGKRQKKLPSELLISDV